MSYNLQRVGISFPDITQKRLLPDEHLRKELRKSLLEAVTEPKTFFERERDDGTIDPLQVFSGLMSRKHHEA